MSKKDGNSIENEKTSRHPGVYGDVVQTQVLVKLPSKETNACDKLPVFFIHPVEGHVQMLSEIAAEVEHPVYGLQLTNACPLTSLSDLAEFYIEHMRTVQDIGPYTIVGYSLGTVIAFEMALQLEEDKIPVQLILIDGSPNYVAAQINVLKTKTVQYPDYVEYAVLLFFTFMFQSKDITDFIQNLRSSNTWKERLDYTLSTLKDVPHSKEHLSIVAELMYKVCLAVDKYIPRGMVQGLVTLLAATKSNVACGSDYGLSKLCKQQVAVHYFEANHESIVHGETATKVASNITRLAYKLK